jgi:hypothetical protein
MIVEKQMECRLAGETEFLGKNLPQRHKPPELWRGTAGDKPPELWRRQVLFYV